MIQRSLYATLYSRIVEEPRRFLQILYGPRQVGKTTLVHQFMQSVDMPVHYATADGMIGNSSIWIEQQWKLARLSLREPGVEQSLLILDEVQKIDNWSEHVKKEWDADSLQGLHLKVILLGSSRLMLQQGLTESLAGQFETNYLGHRTYPEMREAFGVSLEEYIFYGGYPGAATLMDDEARWKSYVRESIIEPSISKDILMITTIHKPALMRQLFETGTLYTTSELSFTKMMGQLQDAGNTTTLSHYLQLLHDAGLLSGLQKYAAQSVRKRASVPKFQVHNNALFSALSPQSMYTLQSSPKEWGQWVESAVGAHLLSLVQHTTTSLYYWREGQHEVDFVLQRGMQTVAIEVKSGQIKNRKGLEAFSAQYNPGSTWVVGPEDIPLSVFLTLSLDDLFSATTNSRHRS